MTADETSAAATPAGSPSAAGPGPEPAAAAGSGPGTLIREARLKARFSIEELAAQTKLNRATLEALERDDFGALLEPVYVRGYYRKCAKVLTLSEAELLARYEKLQAPRQIAPPTKLRLASGGELGGDSSVPRLFIAASAVLAVAVTLFIWLAKPQGSTPAVSDPAPVTVPAAGPTGEAAVEAPAPAVEPPASGLSPGGEGPGTTLPA
ncbi:MAG TPA: helix-turn-helix domain-containing protein, partial [Nevskiaceae bacterium]|nr:helix-turn-helix domain-containing protein [Nevskiaceae bacterium]